MTRGRVYVWIPDPSRHGGGSAVPRVEPLLRLEPDATGNTRLYGDHVEVRNAGALTAIDAATGAIRAAPIGNAQPNANDEFLFDPAGGGGRIDKTPFADGDLRWRYIQAAHFGEVNAYYHLDRIAAYVNELLLELDAPRLPRVTVLVNAHHAATEIDGVRDGIWTGSRWLPFQGGHYRVPSKRYDVNEHNPIAVSGEIHLGPGHRLLKHGALAEAAGAPYRHNASHNAGILYHEYGHHITRQTADLWANAMRSYHRQKNRKTALDEGTCDYWAATLLDTPHIWSWHRRCDCVEVNRRSLTSRKTMADFDVSPNADPHANGTIWAAALWDMRTRLANTDATEGVRRADKLVLQALLLLGMLTGSVEPPTIATVRHARLPFATALAALVRADDILHAGRHRQAILTCFSARGIHPILGVDQDLDRVRPVAP